LNLPINADGTVGDDSVGFFMLADRSLLHQKSCTRLAQHSVVFQPIPFEQAAKPRGDVNDRQEEIQVVSKALFHDGRSEPKSTSDVDQSAEQAEQAAEEAADNKEEAEEAAD